MDCVILAGGKGQRFIDEGISVPKPLITILGEPMIGRLITLVNEAGCKNIIVAANTSMPQLPAYLESLRLSHPHIRVFPANSQNSFLNLYNAAKDLSGRFIAITCDAVFLPTEFNAFRDEFAKARDNEILMVVTRHVDDESPLYAKVNSDGKIVDYRYGGAPFKGDVYISAGIYGLTPEALSITQDGDFPSSLSDFQRQLAHDSRFTLRSFIFHQAFDVDNGHDRRQAEQFLLKAGN